MRGRIKYFFYGKIIFVKLNVCNDYFKYVKKFNNSNEVRSGKDGKYFN